MKRMKRFKFSDLLIGIIFTMLFISIGVIITINFRPLYYLDIKLLDIEKNSGYGRNEILKNYNALIDYSSPFFKGGLSFPTLQASKEGLQHFREVKNIFTSFYIMAALSLAAAIIIIFYKKKKRETSYFLVSSITAIVIPAVIGLILAVDFDRAFVVFHKLFFRNNYWLFDPATDPVILILPDTFFFHCAMLIIFFVLLGSLCMFLVHLRLKKHRRIEYRRMPDMKL